MELKKYIKDNISKLSEDKLLKITCMFAGVIDNHVDDHVEKMKRKVHCIISDGHYNEEFALEDVKKMYYVDNNDDKHFGSYWPLEKIKKIYDSYKGDNLKIFDVYNLYDFYVTINMIKSDNYRLYKNRFKNYGDSELDKLFIEDAINWLDDEDNPYGNSKIWKYLND